MNPVNQNLNVLITNVGSFIARLIGEHIKFSVTTQGAPLPVCVDSLQIEQVLMNLATNARDAMPNGGTFSITSSAGSIDEKYISSLGFGEIGHYAIITVADTGCGMSSDTAQRIFDPFYTTKESGKGTGLGMAMVMGIIKQHKGFIDVHSEVGAGTAFTIYLPLVGADLPEISKESDLQIESGVGTILVAEDDSEVQEYMKRLLTKYGYKVILAVDGQDAVDKYAEHNNEIDLLIFDMVMPKKSGKVACDEIRQMGGTIECLFVSGYAGDFIERQGELGANTLLLSKPIQPQVLLSKIAEILIN
jgi:CheY-like chemotaxis protein